jgi:hypothetical protein
VIKDLWETLVVCTARDDTIRKRGFRACACSIFLHTIPNVWDATVRIPQIR